MSRRSPLRALLIAGALLLTFATQANAQATRTWVSGVGDDVNPCSRTAPCKTFAGAIAETAAGGEINVLDPGGFGAVTITKAITIDMAGISGGILNTGTYGVVINAGATDNVVLRGLAITGGANGSACGYAGVSGVRILKAGTVRLEDVRITRQQKAIDIAPTSPVNVMINRADVADNCVNGVAVAPGAGGSANVTVKDATISNSGTALSVADNGIAWLTGTTLFANALGLQPLGAGQINDYGDNHLIANTADGVATKDLSTPGPAGPAGPAGPTGAQGPQGEPATKLLLATPGTKLAVKTGRVLTLRYAATAAADTTLTVTRGGKTVATVRTTSNEGANVIRWKARAATGTYALKLSAVGGDGQRATANVALKLTK
ncbi:hypothetical protein [Solirubrobacter soli]|uniref:hypothetical protein n=1 Tax=Solirubrobacter soli TaxID=363832 RepID=UPI00040C6458|nr:hypothetical protein [Solirubrobacter soli]